MCEHMPRFTPIIGLEIHVELKTKSKMFCGCKNEPDREAPNTNICEICLAHPGTLPVPNKTAIEWTVKIAKALNCHVNENSKFDRKHYFYPDLPKGYQISQYDQPIGEHGYVELEFYNGKNHRDQARINVTRVHLEEDTAKLTHALSPSQGEIQRGLPSGADTGVSAEDGQPPVALLSEGGRDKSLVDFNRAGVPLVEIVSDPDVESAIEAKTYCQELQLILRYLGVSDADMEKGHMRCEANVSLQETGKFTKKNGVIVPLDGYKLNAKVEVKNINSFRFIEKAIGYEIERQTAMLEKGETWEMETRGWDSEKQKTVRQRVKETAADYRYFPEPDIPPFHPLQIAGELALPELPAARRSRFREEYGFSYADAELLSNDKNWGDYAEQVMSELVDWVSNLDESKKTTAGILRDQKQQLARMAGGWLTSKLMGAMSERKIDIRILKLKPENFAELIALLHTNRINSTNARKALGIMLDTNTDVDPTHIMEEKGLGQVSDESKIAKVVENIIQSHPKQVTEFKAGKEPLIKFLIGMVMKATEGSADPQVAERVLREKLK